MGDGERLEQARELAKRAHDGHFGEKSQIETADLIAGLAEAVAFQGVQIRALIDDVEEIKARFAPFGEEAI